MNKEFEIDKDNFFIEIGMLMEVAARLNEEKDYAVFVRLAGHINEVYVQVCKSKKDYNVIIEEKRFYVDCQDQLDFDNNFKNIKNAIEMIEKYRKRP